MECVLKINSQLLISFCLFYINISSHLFVRCELFDAYSLGIVSLGCFSLGLLLAVGTIAAGIFAIGAIAVGIFALGALSIGMFSVGALAVASHVAIGDSAYGHIAVGRTVAKGAKIFFDHSSHDFSGVSASEVKQAILGEYPKMWGWIVNLITSFLGN